MGIPAENVRSDVGDARFGAKHREWFLFFGLRVPREHFGTAVIYQTLMPEASS